MPENVSIRKPKVYDTQEHCSTFLKFIDASEPGENVVLAPRVSTVAQARNGNLAQQTDYLQDIANCYELNVKGIYERIEPGWDYLNLRDLENFANQYNASVLVACTNRLARSLQDRGTVKTHPLKPGEWGKVKRFIPNRHIYVCLDPFASDQQQKGLLERIGKLAKNNSGGRPWNWERCKAKALELSRTGFGYKKIASRVSQESRRIITRVQVQKWLSRA